MKKIPVVEAIGHPLAHDMTAIRDGTKGVAFRRGHVVQEVDIPTLLAMGKAHIYVGEPVPGQVHEEDAGLEGAKALAGSGLTIEGPAEGRYTLVADRDGLFTVNSGGLKTFNQIPDYTAATLPSHTPVQAGQRVAGVRIVPLVTDSEHVETIRALGVSQGPLLTVRPFLPLKIGIIITGSEVYEGRIQDQFEPVLRAKLAPFDESVLGVAKCPDDLQTILQAADAFLQQGADLILFTGGMSVDPDDLTPTAIRQTGARVVAQGIPLQPGNMLMLAYLGKVPLVGVPGAAIHSRTTALDVVLPRIFVGDKLETADCLTLGEGGFCLGCEVCSYPVCYFGQSL
ncbi:MAG: molybdopterin-binding protein [Oscillospiraceae bacterium]|nr:molybdopterin-binding protein [Oscillospiraceae bacterium]